MSGIRVLVLTPHYLPDGGPSARLFATLCEELAKRGHSVSVVAATPHYPSGRVPTEYRGLRVQRERRNGVRIAWIPVPSVNRRNLWFRLVQSLCFQLGALVVGSRAQYDVIVSSNPALQTGLPFLGLGALRGKPAVFSVHDVYPDVVRELGLFRQGPLVSGIKGLERLCLSKSDFVRILSSSFGTRMRALGVPDSKLVLVYDWVDTDLIKPLPRDNAFAREHGLTDCFVIQYAGNLGLTQGLEHLLLAAQVLQEERDIRFAIVGDGAARADLVAQASRLALRNVSFIPLQPHERLPEVLATADVSVVSLKRGLGAGSLPSKALSILASGRPLLASIDEGTDLQRIVQASNAGVWVPPGSPTAIADAVLALKRDSSLREDLARNGRRYALENHSIQSAADRFEQLLRMAVSNRAAAKQASAHHH